MKLTASIEDSLDGVLEADEHDDAPLELAVGVTALLTCARAAADIDDDCGDVQELAGHIEIAWTQCECAEKLLKRLADALTAAKQARLAASVTHAEVRPRVH